MESSGFWLIWAVLGCCMIIYYMRCKHKIAAFLWGSLSGVSVLTAAHYLGGVIGFAPELNLFNIMQAGILGIPGVVMLAVSSII